MRVIVPAIFLAAFLLVVAPTFAAENSVTYELAPGWNMISAPFETSFSTVENGCQIMPYSGGQSRYMGFKLWRWDSSLGDWSTESTLRPGVGYWIYMNRPCDFTITGSSVASPIVPLKRGWNLVSANGALTDLSGSCQLDDSYLGWAVLWYNPRTSLWEYPSTLESTRAYWIKVKDDCDFGGTRSSTPPSLQQPQIAGDTFNITNSSNGIYGHEFKPPVHVYEVCWQSSSLNHASLVSGTGVVVKGANGQAWFFNKPGLSDERVYPKGAILSGCLERSWVSYYRGYPSNLLVLDNAVSVGVFIGSNNPPDSVSVTINTTA